MTGEHVECPDIGNIDAVEPHLWGGYPGHVGVCITTTRCSTKTMTTSGGPFDAFRILPLVCSSRLCRNNIQEQQRHHVLECVPYPSKTRNQSLFPP